MKKISALLVFSFITGIAFANKPFDLKGDSLGMGLSEFKEKYARSIPGNNKDAPFCSDASPGKKIVTLLSEDWHHDAGIINCRITYPFEDMKGGKPSLAGAPADMLVYHFVDEKLFKISAWINHSDYRKVRDALLDKYGKPTSKKTSEYTNNFGTRFTGETLVWSNSSSTINLIERHGRVDSSGVYFLHKKLNQTAEGKSPAPNANDL